MKINSLYISVKDRDRAKNFYQNIIFEREPSLTTDRFIRKRNFVYADTCQP
jgi:hypothetical protein